MECEQDKFKIAALVDAWTSASLKINEEYQRGARWTQSQKQGLIDSIFRKYPIPPLFLHEIRATGLGGRESVRYDIVDGQQRIRAFADFFSDKYPLLKPNDRKLRLPNSLRAIAAPWAGLRYSELSDDLREYIREQEVDVFLIKIVAEDDEVRDLFIRLQSGTALSRQQIRDAWPGNIGPYIEKLAGKLDRAPSVALFHLVDKRGLRSDDDRDRYDTNRQFCAQLLTLFLARERDPCATQSVGANDLDKLYHEYTTFDTHGPTAEQFQTVLNHATMVLLKSGEKIAASGTRGQRKFKKSDIIATFLLLQDLSKNSLFKVDNSTYASLADHVLSDPDIPRTGRSTSGTAINEYYKQWREGIINDLGVRLDAKRLFDDEDKKAIFARDDSMCGICRERVEVGDDEYDHFPTPWSVGGKTVVDNGRLVHAACHPRGRPSVDDDA